MDTFLEKLRQSPTCQPSTTVGLRLAEQIYESIGYVTCIDNFYLSLARSFAEYYSVGDDITNIHCSSTFKQDFNQITGNIVQKVYLRIEGKCITTKGDYYKFYIDGKATTKKIPKSIFDIFPNPEWTLEKICI